MLKSKENLQNVSLKKQKHSNKDLVKSGSMSSLFGGMIVG